jgi:hypothetical protein
MKKPFKKVYEKLYRMMWPCLLWKYCINCNNEFRKERGWRFICGPYFNGEGHNRYICFDCAKDKYEATKCIRRYFDKIALTMPNIIRKTR